MSNEDGNFKNVDNLTPFEYALAGVPVPEAQRSPSLMVVEQMRRLADEVREAPISQPRLREFLTSGGSIAKRNDRRSLRRRRSDPLTGLADVPDGGGFVDITPAELNGDPDPDADLDAGDDADAGTAAGSGTASEAGTAAVLGGAIAGGAVADFLEIDLTDGDLADGDLTDIRGLEEPIESAPDDIDVVHASIQAEPGDQPAVEQEPPPAAILDETEPLDQALLFGEADGSETAPSAFDSELDELLGAEEADVQDSIHDSVSAPTAAAAPLLFGADKDLNPSADSIPADSLPAEDDLAETVPDDARHRSGDDGAILVPAVGGVPLPGILADEADNTAHLAAVTSGAPPPRGRSGGTVLAFAGSAAAAAALVVGGLWWTNNLNDRTGTESAEAPLVDDSADDSSSAAGDGQGSGGESSDTRSGSESDQSSQTTEFGARDSSTSTSVISTRGSTTTVRGTSTSPRRTTSSSSGSGTSAVGRSSTSGTDQTASTGDGTTISGQPSSTGDITTDTDTTGGPGTAVPTVTAPPQTTRRATTTAPQALAFIGDAVTIGSLSGRGASGVLIELYRDPARNGVEGDLVASRVTSANGRYGFNVAGGCYVVRFYPPDGFEFRDGQARQTTCVDPGGAAARIDAVVHPIARPAPPSGCKVEAPGPESYRGVEVYENSSNWAESYTFYGNTGGVIVRTRDLGPADDVEGSTNREWESVPNGFNHRNVFSVAAERGGVESDPVTCSRESNDD